VSVVVHVRWARTDELTDGHLDLLDDHERDRLTRLQGQADRDRFVLGAAVLRGLVARLEGTEPHLVGLDRTCPRCGAQHGPVSTPGRPWHCSVSHSGSFAVAAVVASAAAATVGVDVETGTPADWEQLLRTVLAPGEDAPVDAAGFVRTWARKEAVVKATREGLARPMSSFDLAAPPDGLRLVDLDVPALDGTGAAAVAVDGPARVQLERARL
jgi:4'-phosphopantetheinyl transferase